MFHVTRFATKYNIARCQIWIFAQKWINLNENSPLLWQRSFLVQSYAMVLMHSSIVVVFMHTAYRTIPTIQQSTYCIWICACAQKNFRYDLEHYSLMHWIDGRIPMAHLMIFSNLATNSMWTLWFTMISGLSPPDIRGSWLVWKLTSKISFGFRVQEWIHCISMHCVVVLCIFIIIFCRVDSGHNKCWNL